MIRPEMQWLLLNEIAVFEDFNHQHLGPRRAAGVEK